MSSIGRYEIEREIGRGSMGIVYLAHDPHVRRRVALKTFLLPPGLTSDQEREYSARFLREAQAAGALSHPAIVTIFDADTDPERGLPFIVMEFVEGGSLRDLMIRNQRLEADRALAMISSLADALRVAHEEGIVHRDIKPANVLLRARDGQAKIVDFGVARMSTSELTGAGDVFGSPAYMSPEQFRGSSVDARSDLFSLATILYQTLCGERPFVGEDMSSLAYSVVHTPAPPIAQLLSGSPHEVDRFFDRALAKDPADRFPDAGAFREAVDELRRALAQQATIALTAREARHVFAVPAMASSALASLGQTARALQDGVRRALSVPEGAPSFGEEPSVRAPSATAPTPAPAASSAAWSSGVSALEGFFAVTMLVLAILPGLWALWPGSPQASAQGLSAVPGSGARASGAAADADDPLAAPTPPVPAARRDAKSSSRRNPRNAAGGTANPMSSSSDGRKTASARPSSASAAAASKSAAPGKRPGSPVSDAARARSSWLPRGTAAPAPESSMTAQDGALASLAAPLSRDPLARPLETPRASAYLVIDVRSLVKDGMVKVLIDGRAVYHRRLSSLDGEGAQPKKLFRRREETFSVRLEIPPGSHTIAAQVFSEGKNEGHEDSETVNLQARETAHLQLVAGRILGSSVSLKQD